METTGPRGEVVTVRPYFLSLNQPAPLGQGGYAVFVDGKLYATTTRLHDAAAILERAAMGL
jgi:hypothetical protein